MCQVRKNHLAHFMPLCHLRLILTRHNDKFESPQTILRTTEPSTYCRSDGIAKKAKIAGEEQIVYLLRAVSETPQWEFRVCHRSGEA